MIHEWVEEDLEATEVQSAAPKVFAWLFGDNSFTPIAKLTTHHAYSVITDHLGTC